MNKLWLVKDRKGRIQGPYTEEEICDYIHEEHFTGSALIALYPSGKWKSISSHPVFYKAILKSLNQPPHEKEKAKEQPTLETKDEMPEEKVLEPTVIIPKDKLKRKRKKIKIRTSPYDYSDDFEEEEEEEEEFQGIKILRLPLIIIVVCALAFMLFFQEEEKKDSSSKRQVRLLNPQKREAPLSPMEAKKEFKQAAVYYKKDTISSYLKAQRQTVQMLERTKNHLLGYAQLCLIHLELWPFAHQDSKDQEARRKVQDRISQIDKGGVAAGLCSAVNAFMSGKYDKSLMIVESSLNALAQKPDESPVFLYYLKAKALTALQRGQEAQNYLRGIYGFLPNWIAPYMLEARIFYEAQNFSGAAKIYQKVLSLFPQHPSAALYLGVIEYNHFKKTKKSERRLKSVLSNLKELVDPRILVEAYTVLTQIALRQNEEGEALRYAEKAYALDPANAAIADIIFKLSGTTQMKKGKIKARQLIYKGDILVDQGQCNEAQEYYKKAYIADKKKNALAAIRMAKCFWKQGMSGEAIQWLKRAIAADPKMTEAYFLLVDYYSARYLFNEAADVLKSASQKNPNSYEIFKGYALLAFRQQNYNVAVNFAKKSLSFYTSDVEVYVLLAKSYRALKEFSEAYKYASKAVEEDVNSVPGQISFAMALGSAYGFSHGEKHFNKLIQNFPVIMEYRQALGEYYFEEQKFEEAENIFVNIIAQSPEFKPAHIYLGRVYSHFAVQTEDGNRLDAAITHFLKAALLDPSDPEPLFYMGRLYMNVEKYSAAEDQFEKIIRMNENYPLIHYYIGSANFLQGGDENLERALKAAKTETQKNPNLAGAYILLGKIHKTKAEKETHPREKRVHFELCKQEYQKAVRLRPKDVSLYISLVSCYVGSGETDSALQIIKQFVKGEGTSGYAELYQLKGKIYEMKGDYQSAGAAYERYFGLNPGAPDRRQIEDRLKSHYQFKKDP